MTVAAAGEHRTVQDSSLGCHWHVRSYSAARDGCGRGGARKAVGNKAAPGTKFTPPIRHPQTCPAASCARFFRGHRSRAAVCATERAGDARRPVERKNPRSVTCPRALIDSSGDRVRQSARLISVEDAVKTRELKTEERGVLRASTARSSRKKCPAGAIKRDAHETMVRNKALDRARAARTHRDSLTLC